MSPPQPPAAKSTQALGEFTFPIDFSLWGTAEIFSDPPRADQPLHTTFQSVHARRPEPSSARHTFSPSESIIGAVVQAAFSVLLFSLLSSQRKLPASKPARLRRFLGGRLEDFAAVPPPKLDEMLAAAEHSVRIRRANRFIYLWVFFWMLGTCVFSDYTRSANWPYPDLFWLPWLVLLVFGGIVALFGRRWYRTALLCELHRLQPMPSVTA